MVEAYYGPIVNNGIQHGRAVEMYVNNQSDSSTYHYSTDLKIIMVVSMDIHPHNTKKSRPF